MAFPPLVKCVIPVAGMGTRFLPATKAQPKEMLPLVDKPVIQYVVEEAARNGFHDIVLVTGRGKQAIENHFDVAFELEHVLAQRDKVEDLKKVQDITHLARFAYVRQGEALGLGHAVLCARTAIGAEPFALLLGDDVFDDASPSLSALVEAYLATGKSVVGVQQVPMKHVSRYGIVSAPPKDCGWWTVEGIVEKPEVEAAPSNWAVVGRYILTPEIFGLLENLNPGHGGEYQLTDALMQLVQTQDLVAAPIPATRYDTGDKLDYLVANIEFALKRDDLKPGLTRYLVELAQSLA